MEIHYLVLCCVLFTTATSLISVDAIPEYSEDNLPLSAQTENCNCENGRCFTDKQGHTKCACKPGYALQDEFTCKPCDCGPLGRCIFTLKPTEDDQVQYQKKCVCDSGSAEKDGECVECFCGDNSACDFENGERRCFCMEGYVEKDGICTRCDCGFYGKCEFENGYKKCECDEGYLELNGICEECDCGEHGTCSFEDGQKICNCQQGFNVNNGKCELCDCGTNSQYCGFTNGVKECTCKDYYAERYGTCEECYCGAFSENCDFSNNQKTCRCMEGYVQKGETCELACGVQRQCQNGGYCKDGFCFCLNGTRGELCEVIDECSNLCPEKGDTECSYDVTSKTAYCRCLNRDLRYDPILKQCRSTCRTDYQCLNGVCRDGLCECIPGTWGDRCEIIDCVNGRMKCYQMKYLFLKEDYLYLLWKGTDTLYILWQQRWMKFVNTGVVVNEVDEKPRRHVRCEDRSYDVIWDGGMTVHVPTQQNKYLRFLIAYSENERCGVQQLN